MIEISFARRAEAPDRAAAGRRIQVATAFADVLRRRLAVVLACVALLLGAIAPAFGADDAADKAGATGSVGSVATVSVDGKTIFRVAGVSAFPARERARAVEGRIKAFAGQASRSVDEIMLLEEGDRSIISHGTTTLVILFEADARLEGVERPVLAQVITERIKQVVSDYRHERSTAYLGDKAVFTVLATMLLVVALWASRWLIRRLTIRLENRYKSSLRGLRIDSFEIIQQEHLWTLLRSATTALWGVLALLFLYTYLEEVLSQLPWTRGIARELVKLVVDPLETMGAAAFGYLPSLAFLVILFLLVRYLLKLTQFFFIGVSRGTVKLVGFEPEWAMPTYSLIRVAIVAFSLVIAFPYMPGSSSDAFKGISVFIGVLLSIGSSTIIGNTMAGYSLLYRGAFRIGDRVKIGANVGDIIAIRQQVTQLRTPKNEIIVIPNSMILNSEIVNFSTMAREGQLLMHTSITIGYDTPWRQVEAMMLEAARRTDGLLTDPPPFVLENSLDDFYVAYELNACYKDADKAPALYAAVHRNILDVFNESGVQIMSPHFIAQPEAAVLVPRDQWYAAPAKAPEAP